MTLGRLVTMAEGLRREQWTHTSQLLAELLNGPRPRKDKRPWVPSQLNPYAPRSATAHDKVSRKAFVRSLISTWI